ncbi:MAG: type II toxin-antitoxin system PemK/MazF family toxin [Planctomycetota bacterium]
MSGPRRGEIWWAELAPPRGSEPGHPRPVLVLQSNRFNESRIETVVVAAVTSNLRLALAPGNVRVGLSASGLPKPSVINISQILTLSREYLKSRAGALPASVMNDVADGLRLVLGL